MIRRLATVAPLFISLLTPSLSMGVGIVSKHDPQIVGAGISGYFIYRNGQKIQATRAQLASYIDGLAREIQSAESKAQSLKLESSEAAKGKMISKTMGGASNVYSGKFANGQTYVNGVQNGALLKDNTYRLLGSGVDALVDKMKAVPEMANNNNISVRVQTIQGVVMGQFDGVESIERTKTDSKTISGTINQVAEKLRTMVSEYRPDSAKGSIIKLDVNYEVRGTPNPTLSKSLAAQAKDEGARAKQLASEKDGKVKKATEAKDSKIRSLKNWNKGNAAIIVGLIGLSYVREATAEELISIDQACNNYAALELKATGISLRENGDANPADVQEIALGLEEACAQM